MFIYSTTPKLHVLAGFKIFFTKVHIETNLFQVKPLKSINGGEFSSNAFKALYCMLLNKPLPFRLSRQRREAQSLACGLGLTTTTSGL